MNRLTILCVFLFLGMGGAADPAFVVEPYLQLGASQPSASNSIVVMWHAADADSSWDVQSKKAADAVWSAPVRPAFTTVIVRGIEPHRVFRALLENLTPGEEFDYRVRIAGRVVFTARARARKSEAQPYRF